jgi:hypothetical protein
MDGALRAPAYISKDIWQGLRRYEKTPLLLAQRAFGPDRLPPPKWRSGPHTPLTPHLLISQSPARDEKLLGVKKRANSIRGYIPLAAFFTEHNLG